MSIDFQVLGKPYHDNALYVEVKPGQAVHRILFDCGEKTLDDLRPADIMAADHLCFSHFHLDHIAGFDTFIRMNYNRETKPVKIWGPENSPEIIRHRLRGVTWDRVEDSPGVWEVTGIANDTLKKNRLLTRDEFKKIHDLEEALRETVIFSHEEYTISATLLSHRSPTVAFRVTENSEYVIDKSVMDEMGFSGGPWAAQVKDLSIAADKKVQIQGEEYAVGYLRDRLLTEQPGDSIAYATDYINDESTIESLTEMIRGCRVFVSEATYNKDDEALAEKYYHMTSEQVATIARNAGVEELVLLHFSKRYQNTGYEKLLTDAQRIFPETRIPVHW